MPGPTGNTGLELSERPWFGAAAATFGSNGGSRRSGGGRPDEAACGCCICAACSVSLLLDRPQTVAGGRAGFRRHHARSGRQLPRSQWRWRPYVKRCNAARRPKRAWPSTAPAAPLPPPPLPPLPLWAAPGASAARQAWCTRWASPLQVMLWHKGWHAGTWSVACSVCCAPCGWSLCCAAMRLLPSSSCPLREPHAVTPCLNFPLQDEEDHTRPTTPWVRSVISGVDLMRDARVRRRRQSLPLHRAVAVHARLQHGRQCNLPAAMQPACCAWCAALWAADVQR